jgi:ATP-dependent protease Clp ATPase subunit
MNQGIYFGQLVIGPAGSGKVLLYFTLVNIL